MSFAVIRTSLCKINVAGSAVSKGWSPITCGRIPVVTQVATLKATHGGKYPYHPEPFPYESKRYTWWRQFGDHTRKRLCENSKVITVDGHPAVGKNEFAKRLCNEFDLKFFPSVTDSDIYINSQNGLDMRMFNEFLPEKAMYYDLKVFANDRNPEIGRMALMQTYFYIAKFRRYCKALQHMFSTGQGVVLVNSVYSDDVFLETLTQMGYIKRTFPKSYYEIRDNTICELLPPHLCIYLDAPVSTIRENLKKRNDPLEPKYTDKFLQNFEDNWKNRFMKKMRPNCEIMEIDWTEPADDLDMDWIAEEIGLLSLESEDLEDTKFHEWYNRSDDDLDQLRKMVGEAKVLDTLIATALTPVRAEELFWTQDDHEIVEAVIKENPAFYGRKGYIPEYKDNPYMKFW